MGKFKPKKFAVSMLVIIIGFVIILNYATDDQSFGFELVPTNAIVTIIDDSGKPVDVEIQDYLNESVACWLQNEMEIINRDGESRGFVKSDYLKINPSIPLRISDSEGAKGLLNPTPILTGDGGFIVKPTIRCSVDFTKSLTPEDTFGVNPITGDLLYPENAKFQGGLIVQPSELVIRVYANDETDCPIFSCNSKAIYHDIYHVKIDIPRQEINDNGKKALQSYKIEDEDLESGLRVDGQYLSNLLFTIDGVVNITYAYSEDVNYIIPINTDRDFRGGNTAYGDNNWGNINNDLLTERSILVQKNIDIIFGDKCDTGFHLEPPSGSAPHDCVADGKPIDEVCEVDEYENPIGSGNCIPIETQPKTCNPPLIQQGSICVNPNTNTGGSGLTGIVIIDQFVACISSGDPTCLTSPTFLIIWIGLFGFVILMVAIAQGKGGSRSTDIYGVPSNF